MWWEPEWLAEVHPIKIARCELKYCQPEHVNSIDERWYGPMAEHEMTFMRTTHFSESMIDGIPVEKKKNIRRFRRLVNIFRSKRIFEPRTHRWLSGFI